MYLDSAIIVKLVVHETDSLHYARQVDGQSGIWSSALAGPECFSALYRKVREGAISESVRASAWRRIETFLELGMIRWMGVTDAVLVNARRHIADCHPEILLRSLDAIHLATAEHVGAYPLYTNEVRLRAAAEHQGIPLGPLAEKN